MSSARVFRALHDLAVAIGGVLDPVELARLWELLEEWRTRKGGASLCAEPVGCGAGSLEASE